MSNPNCPVSRADHIDAAARALLELSSASGRGPRLKALADAIALPVDPQPAMPVAEVLRELREDLLRMFDEDAPCRNWVISEIDSLITSERRDKQ